VESQSVRRAASGVVTIRTAPLPSLNRRVGRLKGQSVRLREGPSALAAAHGRLARAQACFQGPRIGAAGRNMASDQRKCEIGEPASVSPHWRAGTLATQLLLMRWRGCAAAPAAAPPGLGMRGMRPGQHRVAFCAVGSPSRSAAAGPPGVQAVLFESVDQVINDVRRILHDSPQHATNLAGSAHFDALSQRDEAPGSWDTRTLTAVRRRALGNHGAGWSGGDVLVVPQVMASTPPKVG
jgi:hypothetical protein